MIGKIKGILAEVDGTVGLIETASGVYYRVYLTTALLASSQPAHPIEVYTYHVVREDAQMLFGFENKKEYTVFELLLSVPGVGPKSAFSIISFSTVDEIIEAVRGNDAKYFTRIKGLGKKTALKIILELANRFDSEFVYTPEITLSADEQTVVDALASLGFAKKEAQELVTKLPSDLSVEDKIRIGIQRMSTQSS